MADRKPLVLDSAAAIQQLQAKDDLDIPLNDRVQALEVKFQKLVDWLRLEEIDIPFDI